MAECVICTCDIDSPAPPHVNSNGVPCAAHFCCECLLKALQYDPRCPTCRVHLAHPGITSDDKSEDGGPLYYPSFSSVSSDDEDYSGRNWDEEWDEEELAEMAEREDEWVGYLCSTLFCPEEERRLREEEEECEGYDASILFEESDFEWWEIW